MTKTAYGYAKIDAFTAGNSLGNPAACLYLSPDQRPGGREMLSIAKQHKGFVSEVVYCTSGPDGIGLTYYSSECEVDFCGHGTIACLYHLIQTTPALLAQAEIQFHTHQKGTLTAYNRIPESDAVLIAAPAPQWIGTELGREAVAAALGLAAQTIHETLPIDLIDAGLRTLIVPLRDLETEVSVFPDEKTLKAFCEANGIGILLVFAMETERPGRHAHTRVFAPRFGYLEDPATGSGNSAFGYYMLQNGLWNGADCLLEQGGSDRVYNEIRLAAPGGRVLFGGSATVRIDGLYYV